MDVEKLTAAVEVEEGDDDIKLEDAKLNECCNIGARGKGQMIGTLGRSLTFARALTLSSPASIITPPECLSPLKSGTSHIHMLEAQATASSLPLQI